MHRVVIVGCGFAGLFAARALRRAPVEVVVVDRTNHHLFQPLLYQVATGVLSEGDIAPPIRDILRHQRNARVLLGGVVDIDVDERQLTIDTLGRETELSYDSLIVATGVSQSYFGHDEYAADAPGMKTIDDALELRGRIFGAFEMAELEPDAAAREAWLTFAIVGAGPTGVELAGQIAELSRRALGDNFRRFDPRTARIVLLDGLDTVLPSFPERLRKRAQRDLERLGVEVRLGTRVVGVDETGLDVSTATRRRVASRRARRSGRPGSRLRRWAGCSPTAPARRRPLRPRRGAARLLAARSSRGVRRRRPDGAERASPAWPRSRCRAATTRREPSSAGCRATPTKPFRYFDLGTMATISRFRAVVSVGRLQIGGFLGWLMWLVVHLAFMTGFKNRAATVANWAVAFLGRGPTPAHDHQAAGARPDQGRPRYRRRTDGRP